MKTIGEIKAAISSFTNARLRGEERRKALKKIHDDLSEIELAVCRDPGFMDFHQVGELKSVIKIVQEKMA